MVLKEKDNPYDMKVIEYRKIKGKEAGKGPNF